MRMALQHASIGKGGTYPNPAVGCVLVEHSDAPPGDNTEGDDEGDRIIGQGFHPAAGMPHAEVFAMFEACGYVDDGVEAAKSVMPPTARSTGPKSDRNANELQNTVKELLKTYASENGPSKLFGNAFTSGSDENAGKVTAYVTLEPCCHYGQTPPCAMSLKEAGVSRVVVGYRDPNPRVDGGGVKLLREAGVQVDFVGNGTVEESKLAKQCADMVTCFAKRIAPRPGGCMDYENMINGAKRRGLRSLKERRVSDGTITEVTWPSRGSFLDTSDESINLCVVAQELPIDARWMEHLDEALWKHELVLMRLGNAIKPSKKNASANRNSDDDDIADELVLTKLGKAVSKKRGVRIVANRIASELNAHLAQVKGHTALLYRPGLPPTLHLDELVAGTEGDES